jgi:hypothetical protein
LVVVVEFSTFAFAFWDRDPTGVLFL